MCCSPDLEILINITYLKKTRNKICSLSTFNCYNSTLKSEKNHSTHPTRGIDNTGMTHLSIELVIVRSSGALWSLVIKHVYEDINLTHLKKTRNKICSPAEWGRGLPILKQ